MTVLADVTEVTVLPDVAIWAGELGLWLSRSATCRRIALSITCRLTGADLEDFLAARAAGSDELAAQIACTAYGLDAGFVLALDDVNEFSFIWPDSDEWENRWYRR